MRGATDLVALIGDHVALRRQGRRFVGRCPFHAERTPSFSVNPELGLYHCFGCQASGDAFSFVQAVEHLPFVDAVERLAERAGVELQREDATAVARRHKRTRLLEAMEAAVAWYHERLLSHPQAGRARHYLRSRGYDSETVRRFRLGWAPDDWDALCRALGLSQEVLVETGLGFVNRRGRRQDAFRGRIIFPIFDVAGRAIALGGRVLPPPDGEAGARPPEAGPKYKNSPETPIYAKRRTLYGLNWAKTAVVETGEVVVCEGYTDVIALFQAGVPRAVATCGTALADEHVRLLANFARRVVLAYDADRAGQAAAERFYEWEQTHHLDIAVGAFPSGADPADLGHQDPGALREAIAGARPFLAFRVDRILDGGDLSSAEGRARAAEAALEAVAEHPNELVRDQYVMSVAGRCRADPDHLRAILARLRRRGGGSPAPPAGRGRGGGSSGARSEEPRPGAPSDRRGGGPGRTDRLELEALRLAIHRPQDVADQLEEVLFADPLCRQAFIALAGSTTLHEATTGAEPQVVDLLGRLAVEETTADPADVVQLLVKSATKRALARLDAEARASESRFVELAPLTGWLKLGLEDLDRPDAAVEAADRLLAWLTGWESEVR